MSLLPSSFPLQSICRTLLQASAAAFLLSAFVSDGVAQTVGEGGAWRDDWAVETGLTIRQDSEGYDFPTALAFVPEPGVDPNDPLYYVTELRGTIKVVTNDRQVRVFAEDFFSLVPERELPAIAGEIGLAGICLEPVRGYVFATFAYQDAGNVLRNGIVRFQTAPGEFGVSYTSQLFISEPFANDVSSVSHQIGPCQIRDDLLYVSVGDGEQPKQSQNTESSLGKIVRMTFDGDPVPANPLYRSAEVDVPANYLWAWGLRNPFGLKIVGSSLFVADNGQRLDRFTKVEEGGNYKWDGTDWSIGSAAEIVWYPPVAPVQMDFLPAGTGALSPDYDDHFFVATSGVPVNPGPGTPGAKGIIAFEYDIANSSVTTVPRTVLRFRGAGRQSVVGLAVGPDALYFAPLFPDADGTSSILKLVSDPDEVWHISLTEHENARQLMREKGCFGCHTLDNNGGGTIAPVLDGGPLRSRIEAFVNSESYAATVAEVDQIDAEPFRSSRGARHAVLEAEGEERLRLWLYHRLREPRFDSPGSQMPNLEISDAEASLMVDYLLVPPPSITDRGRQLMRRVIPVVRFRHLFGALVAGMVLGGMLTLLVGRRRTGSQSRG